MAQKGLIKNIKKDPTMVVDGMKILFESYITYKKTVEIEKSKRENIRTERDIALSRINSQKQVLQEYFEYTFAERKNNFQKLFSVLDKGIESDNSELIIKSLDSIVEIAKDSPLKGMRQLLSDYEDNNVKEIEI